MGCAGPIICIFQTVLKMYINISFYISSNKSIDLGNGTIQRGCFLWRWLTFVGQIFRQFKRVRLKGVYRYVIGVKCWRLVPTCWFCCFNNVQRCCVQHQLGRRLRLKCWCRSWVLSRNINRLPHMVKCMCCIIPWGWSVGVGKGAFGLTLSSSLPLVLEYLFQTTCCLVLIWSL
jgi:hypothetical protein